MTTARAWQARRAELLDDFTRIVSALVTGRPVRGRDVVGRLERDGHRVDIALRVVLPVDAPGPVPVMRLFRGGGLPGDPPIVRPGLPPLPPRQPGDDPPGTEQLIAAGWGYALLDPTTVQPDHGAGLTHGVIGLMNRGRRRTPEDWGALRAWAWGASRALDHLAGDPAVDASRVGIGGVSRYGKAALATMAYDTRFAVGFIASSGAGGAKLYRRTYGEVIENLTGSGEYHWFAGALLRFGAAEARDGVKTPMDLPVDSHALIALSAPRHLFISHGIPEKGDAHWIDQRGAWMATLAAAPVYRLLGRPTPGLEGPWRTTPMPAVNEDRLDGRLAWRQHDGGHTDQPNWRHVLRWMGSVR